MILIFALDIECVVGSELRYSIAQPVNERLTSSARIGCYVKLSFGAGAIALLGNQREPHADRT